MTTNYKRKGSLHTKSHQ